MWFFVLCFFLISYYLIKKVVSTFFKLFLNKQDETYTKTISSLKSKKKKTDFEDSPKNQKQIFENIGKTIGTHMRYDIRRERQEKIFVQWIELISLTGAFLVLYFGVTDQFTQFFIVWMTTIKQWVLSLF
ncbi:MAG: hypothetical protein CMC18_03165 [Flavobacteriaceae bacterium]|nr:hypothetical protein [Flavobacteriaceae bacterium]